MTSVHRRQVATSLDTGNVPIASHGAGVARAARAYTASAGAAHGSRWSRAIRSAANTKSRGGTRCSLSGPATQRNERIAQPMWVRGWGGRSNAMLTHTEIGRAHV